MPVTSILDTTVDRPWSQYFCCMLAGNREYVQRHPVATRRVMRAILKATDLCANEPARVAQQLVGRGLTGQYDYQRQALSEMPYYNGGTTTPRTRSGFMPCAFTKRV